MVVGTLVGGIKYLPSNFIMAKKRECDHLLTKQRKWVCIDNKMGMY